MGTPYNISATGTFCLDETDSESKISQKSAQNKSCFRALEN